MKSHSAKCSCEQVQLICSGEPVRISMCHCHECQKRTGSVFGVQARFPIENVQIIGNAKPYTRSGDSGGKVTFHFCPNCGSTLYWQAEGYDVTTIAVAVGNFTDATFPAPSISVYENRRHPWTVMPHQIEEKNK